MKAQFKVSPKLIVEVESDSQRSMFEDLAKVSEIFGQDACGKCKSSNIKFVVRNATTKDKKPVKYYSMDCMECHAKLSIGQHMENPDNMFVRRKNKEGEWIVDSGWTKWDKEAQASI